MCIRDSLHAAIALAQPSFTPASISALALHERLGRYAPQHAFVAFRPPVYNGQRAAPRSGLREPSVGCT
eukprot:4506293-Pyramimonas_sp.AAC.1